MPGMSISYQGKVIFPGNSLSQFLNTTDVKANVPVFSGYIPSDYTRKNYRIITFQAGDDPNTSKLTLSGITIYNQVVEEVITLNGTNPVNSANMYRQFQVIPQADIPGLTIGNAEGMSDLIFYDGTPTNHRVIVSGDSSISYTVYGLLNPAPMTLTELNIERYQLDADLSGSATTNGSVEYAGAAQRIYIDVPTISPGMDLTWYWTTYSNL